MQSTSASVGRQRRQNCTSAGWEHNVPSLFVSLPKRYRPSTTYLTKKPAG